MFRKFCLLFLTLTLALSACGTLQVAIEHTPTPSVDPDTVAMIVAATLAATPSPTPNVDVWTWHNIDLYALKIQLPYDWTITEINRRLEPTGPGYPTPEHDCAEYSVSSPDGTMKIFLKPDCVFFEANPVECLDDVVLMARDESANVRYDNLAEDGLIGRYYDKEKSTYIYSDIGYPTIRGQTKMMCYGDGSIVIQKGIQNGKKIMNFIHAEFQYLGSEPNLDQLLRTIDKIVLSISKA